MSDSTTLSVILLLVFVSPFSVALCIILWRMVATETRIRDQEDYEMSQALGLIPDPPYTLPEDGKLKWLDNEREARELAHQLKIGAALTSGQYEVLQKSREFVSKFNGIVENSWWHTQQLTGPCVGCGYPLSSAFDHRRASWGCPRCKR